MSPSFTFVTPHFGDTRMNPYVTMRCHHLICRWWFQAGYNKGKRNEQGDWRLEGHGAHCGYRSTIPFDDYGTPIDPTDTPMTKNAFAISIQMDPPISILSSTSIHYYASSTQMNHLDTIRCPSIDVSVQMDALVAPLPLFTSVFTQTNHIECLEPENASNIVFNTSPALFHAVFNSQLSIEPLAPTSIISKLEKHPISTDFTQESHILEKSTIPSQSPYPNSFEHTNDVPQAHTTMSTPNDVISRPPTLTTTTSSSLPPAMARLEKSSGFSIGLKTSRLEAVLDLVAPEETISGTETPSKNSLFAQKHMFLTTVTRNPKNRQFRNISTGQTMRSYLLRHQ